MRTKVQLWGNSIAFRIPRYIARQLNINVGSHVDITLDNDVIIIKPIKSKDKKLQSYLSKISDENIHKEFDFGDSEGKEIW